MAKIEWVANTQDYDYGIDRGVLYFNNVAKDYFPWNGLISVEQKPEASEPKPLYFDGVCYNVQQEPAEYTAVVKALYFPYLLEDHILALCDTRTLSATSEQATPFHFTFRSNTPTGYKIHLLYNVMATFSGYSYETISDSVSLDPFSLEFYATPESVPGYKATSYFIVDSSRAYDTTLGNLEDILYGTESSTPRFPTASELISIFGVNDPLLAGREVLPEV